MDATKRPLLIPPKFATYAEQHDVFDLLKRLLEQLLIKKPDDPLTFIKEQLKKDNDDVPRIVVVGPPASGQTSVGKMVANKLRTAFLTQDNIIEEASTSLKQEAKKYKDNNEPLPTELWVKLMDERMALFDCVKKGWVLSGFPETREQALALQAAGIHPKHCVLLDAPDTVLIERAVGKRVDPKTQDIYHITFDRPNSLEVVNRLQEVPGNSEDEIIEKLVLFHRHIDPVIESMKKCYKIINADQPKSDVFAQVMTFLCSSPRTAAPHTPRIVLLGATGSGKAVQAALIANKYNIVNVQCGQLIKQAIAGETKNGGACKPYVEKGMMVPDAIVLEVLKERLGQLDSVSRGWVLHGYPRTREQAEQLSGAGFVPNRAFFLDVPTDSAIERLTMRAMDPITGEHYHLMYNPPRTQEIKDRLQVQPKDREEAVRKRLTQYQAYAEEVNDYYESAQHVNADQDPHTVFECMESMIVNPLPQQLD